MKLVMRDKDDLAYHVQGEGTGLWRLLVLGILAINAIIAGVVWYYATKG